MAASDPTPYVATPTGTLQGVAAFSWDGSAWQPSGRAGPDVATSTGVLQGVAPFSWSGSAWTPAGRSQPGVSTPSGVLDGVAVYTWSGSAWTPASGTATPSTPSGALRGVAAFSWDGGAWQPAALARASVPTPYGVLDGVAMFEWGGSSWQAGAAVPAGASLDLSFLSGTLDPRITFTRASTATYFDSSGTMQTAATNAPRFDYDPVTHALRGLLIEEARTNLMLFSADASNVTWAKSGTGPSVVGNSTTAPDGTMTASMAQYAAVGAATFGLLNQPIVVTANVYTFSVYLRGFAGGEQIYLCISGTAFYSSPRITLTTQWQRYVFVTPTLAAGTQYFAVGCDTRDVTQNPIPAENLYVWGAQLELGAFPTSYIPTTAAAVTRAQDTCQMPVAAWYNTTTGSLAHEYLLEGVPPGYSAPAAFVGASVDTDFIDLEEYAQGTATAPILHVVAMVMTGNATRSATFIAAPTVSAGSVHRGAVAWLLNNVVRGAHDGTLTTVDGSGAATAIPTLVNLTIGGPKGFQPMVSQWARRVRYWPRALSDAEMQSVTT